MWEFTLRFSKKKDLNKLYSTLIHPNFCYSYIEFSFELLFYSCSSDASIVIIDRNGNYFSER